MPRSQPLAPVNPQGAPTLEPVTIPGAPGWHALNGHIAWFLPQLLLICGCMQSLWGPEVRLLAAPGSKRALKGLDLLLKLSRLPAEPVGPEVRLPASLSSMQSLCGTWM